ncbi:MAG: hypothetical protein A2Z12_08780 [Actinobacteria bacterium RBG_16_68_21]|nr:MAG: hypothetical protein A2Z12_08780 [Actinobacteria bacterium RBG_16_68_21]
MADLNQLEQYVVIAPEYDDSIKSFEAILVRRKKSKDLDQVLRVRSNSFKVRIYTDLLAQAERRYVAHI